MTIRRGLERVHHRVEVERDGLVRLVDGYRLDRGGLLQSRLEIDNRLGRRRRLHRERWRRYRRLGGLRQLRERIECGVQLREWIVRRCGDVCGRVESGERIDGRFNRGWIDPRSFEAGLCFDDLFVRGVQPVRRLDRLDGFVFIRRRGGDAKPRFDVAVRRRDDFLPPCVGIAGAPRLGEGACVGGERVPQREVTVLLVRRDANQLAEGIDGVRGRVGELRQRLPHSRVVRVDRRGFLEAGAGFGAIDRRRHAPGQQGLP